MKMTLTGSAGLAFRFLERVFLGLGRFAPEAARDVKGPEAIQTFRAVCQAGFLRRGLLGLVHEGSRECLDLAWTITLMRVEAMPPLASPQVTPLLRDLRLAWRSLMHARTSSVIAITTLAVGIGVNAAVFSVLDATLWRQVPFRDSDRLVEVWNFSPAQKITFAGLVRPQAQAWRQQRDLFDRVEAFSSETLVYETGLGAETIEGAVVTPGTFELLGASAALGRTFAVDEGRGGSSGLAVISDRFWRERLGSPPDVISVNLKFGARTYRVVGVMPKAFRFPSGLEDVWIPYDIEQPPPDEPAGRSMTPLARLAQGVTFERALAEVTARGERVSTSAGGPPGVTAALMRPGRDVEDQTSTSLWVLSGAVSFVFLIVCANVSNLALSRALSRTRDLATCAAMGASPSALVRTTALEQLMVAGAGVLAGFVVAQAAIRIAVSALPETMTAGTLNAIDLDSRALWFMVAAGMSAALVCGLPPAVMAARATITAVTAGDTRSTGGSRQARRFRSALAVVEVGVSVVLLIGAAVMARSFIALASQDQGFDTHGLISLRVGLPANGYQDPRQRDVAAADIVARLSAIPGVTGATVGGLPSDTTMITMGTMEFADRPANSPRGSCFPCTKYRPAISRRWAFPSWPAGHSSLTTSRAQSSSTNGWRRSTFRMASRSAGNSGCQASPGGPWWEWWAIPWQTLNEGVAESNCSTRWARRLA